jgi:diguanylate cyclase (GGDEF)-like protein
MGRKSSQKTPDGESGRDSRLKLILLAVALVLVAGYAVSVTEMASVVSRAIVLLGSDLPILPVAAACAAVAIVAVAFLVVRARRPSKAKSKSAEGPGSVASLARRREFLKTLAGQIESHAKSGRQLAIHLIDIDRFRVVNDVLGEGEGDALLRLLAERLLVLVNHSERLARIGDDEFAVIQPEVGGARHAEIYARRIEETCKDICAQVPRHARPSASVGIAVYPEHGEDAAKLLHSASLALHAAKQAGGDTFYVFSRDMEMAIDARLKMEKAISDGLHEGWFELHFQPQYDLLSRRLTGFEALVRMKHPELGELLPAAFLPVAEGSGLIQPLGEWIIRDALSTASHWPTHLILSINVSLAQLRHGDIATVITSMLSKTGMNGSRLRLEIPEAALFEKSGAIKEQLRRLKGRGVTIVLDDFGLNHSRLKSLADMPCDAVKLDRSLIEHVGEEPEVENLVRSLIGTAHSFDLDVLAEGVERAEQAHFLISHDCQHVQGFLFGRPAHARDLGAIIGKDTRKAADEESGPAEATRSVA